MSFIKINDRLKKRNKQEVRLVPSALGGARIKVLVGSCGHCAKLRDNVIEAMHNLGLAESSLETITDIASIAKMGILATPALIVDGKLVSCGKVLTVPEITKLIAEDQKSE